MSLSPPIQSKPRTMDPMARRKGKEGRGGGGKRGRRGEREKGKGMDKQSRER